MSKPMRAKFELFGPLAGKTTKINGHQFTNGVYFIVTSSQILGHLSAVLSKSQAYMVGSAEWEAAVARREKANAEANLVQAGALRDPAEALSGEPVGEQQPPAEVPGASGGGASDPTGGAAGSVPERDGHEKPGAEPKGGAPVTEPSPPVVANEKVAAALAKLDPADDSHWTEAGLPSLEAIEQAMGGATGVTRADVEGVKPGFTREAALVARDLA